MNPGARTRRDGLATNSLGADGTFQRSTRFGHNASLTSPSISVLTAGVTNPASDRLRMDDQSRICGRTAGLRSETGENNKVLGASRTRAKQRDHSRCSHVVNVTVNPRTTFPVKAKLPSFMPDPLLQHRVARNERLSILLCARITTQSFDHLPSIGRVHTSESRNTGDAQIGTGRRA